jgi:sugar phosphate isomerase/epimerase
MQFGVCAPLRDASLYKAGGWDYIEENAQRLLEPEKPADGWIGRDAVAAAPLPVLALNALIPPQVKIIGPAADPAALQTYMTELTRRARALGIKTLALGAPKPRNIPDGFSPAAARDQLIAFGVMSAALAARHEMVIVLESLNKSESNFINSLTDALDIVRAVSNSHFQCMVDSHHFWREAESLEALAAAAPWIRHVHLAAPDRSIAGADGTSRFRDFFRVLKNAGYRGRISVEAQWTPDSPAAAAYVLDAIKRDWAAA